MDIELQKLSAWQALQARAKGIAALNMEQLFQTDAQRFAKFSLQQAGLFLDYSKNLIDDEIFNSLLLLAEQCNLKSAIHNLFRGELVNSSENKAELHTALRNVSAQPIFVAGRDVMPEISAVWQKMRLLCEQVRSRQWHGISDAAITDVVNIGIGGSELGPKMVVTALKHYADSAIRVHFISNLDAQALIDLLPTLQPESSIFLISSKSFTTLDTLTNAESIRAWFNSKTGDNDSWQKHFFAITENVAKAKSFGIQAEHIFPLWPWVSGRFSLWSAIGLPIALSIGMDHFLQLLAGAHDMDQHFQTAAWSQNMPVILALLSVWYNNFLGAQTQAVIPYSERLKYFPEYLQQLVMESNGKSVTKMGQPIGYQTSAIIWGGIGSNSQHAFHQLLHQGTHLIPTDFILPLVGCHELDHHQQLLVAMCFSQSEALLKGKSLDEVEAELRAAQLSAGEIKKLAPHKVFSGNQPSNMLLLDQLTPRALGALLALYEHKVFVESVIWGINAFDQWGVELGKQLSSRVLRSLQGDAAQEEHDASTSGLIDYYRSLTEKFSCLK